MKNGHISPNPQTFVEDLPVVGVTQFTTIDYPGALAAVFYTQGCPWRCRYCHNSHLREMQEKPADKIPWDKLDYFLESRKKFLEAVVFCGGEPTIHPELKEAMQVVKRWGYRVGLHTAGMSTAMLERVLPFCDWVGMDIKAPFENYERITGVPHSGEQARESALKLITSGVSYEFRTTVHPELLSEADIQTAAKELRGIGADHYVLQLFRSTGCQDPWLNRLSSGMARISYELEAVLKSMFQHFEIRTES